MNKKREAKVIGGVGGRKYAIDFRRYTIRQLLNLRISIRTDSEQEPSSKERNKKNDIIDSQAGQRRNPQRSFKRNQSPKRPPDPAQSSTTIKPGSRRHLRWNRTQRPNSRNPISSGLLLASRLWLCAATCPGRVLARDPFDRLLHQLQCATFFAAEIQSHRPQARMQCHDGLASPGTRKAI